MVAELKSKANKRPEQLNPRWWQKPLRRRYLAADLTVQKTWR